MFKIAICTTLKDSEPYLDNYINYHLSIGFDHMLLFFDDPHDVSIAKYAGRKDIIAVKKDEELLRKWKKVKDYRKWEPFIDSDLIARQVLNMNVALKMAVEMDIDWLLHIDTDELFYLPGEDARQHFQQLSAEKTDMARYHNHEAIPEMMDTVDFFRDVTLFKRNFRTLNNTQQEIVRKYTSAERPYFNYYDNGKSAVRVKKNVFSNGPHGFCFRPGILERLLPVNRPRIVVLDSPYILHYACCGFGYFWRKYDVLGNFPDKWNGRIEINKYLPVHIASRDVWREGNQESARHFYHKYFIETPFRDRGLFVKEGICFEVSANDKIKPR